MKKCFLLTVLLGGLSTAWSQNIKFDCEKEIATLNMAFIERLHSDSLAASTIKDYQTKLLATADNAYIDSIRSINDERITLKKEINSIYNRFSSYRMVCEDEGLSQKKIDSLFIHHDYITVNLTEEITKKAIIYTYFGDNKIVKEDFFANPDSNEAQIIKQVLAENSESYLGDITIPKENQQLFFCDSDSSPTRFAYAFKKIELEIRDGYFTDIRVFVEYKGNIHTFENRVGVSLLSFATYAKSNYLSYKQTTINNMPINSNEEMDDFSIRLGDVMMYNYEMGSHYIPDNLVLKFPENDVNNNKTNQENPATYRIKQKTDLDKILELRTYTDFLALFGDSNNGLVQIEGKAKFFAFPFPLQIKYGAQVQLLPSVSPYVNYSRLDEDVRYVNITSDSLGQNTITAPLELVEKRFLTMGMEANLVQIEHKDFPVRANLYGFANYQLSETNLGNDSITNVHNIKAASYGGGLQFSAKRFRNFGFNYKLDVSWYDYDNFNTIETLTLPASLLPVFRHEAEVHYHPANKPNSALFVRLITNNHSSSKNKEAFYQFQVGYKFSIGSRVINK